jgi:broad-specificity NMP kinase
MFNVCPGCGQYTNAKTVVEMPTRAVCPDCKYEHEFLSLPLFVVTGASCTGKTTASLELTKTRGNYVVLDQDILWNDKWNGAGSDVHLFRDTWLRMIKNIHQAGRSVILFGSCTAGQYESCIERRYIGAIHYLALVCEPAELEHRLLDRPQWRGSGSSENVRQMLEFNQWFLENASKTQPNITLLDTTQITVAETVNSIREWVRLGHGNDLANSARNFVSPVNGVDDFLN